MDKDFTPLITELATGVWKLQGNLAAGEAPKALRRSLNRQIKSMLQALADEGVGFQSYTGKPFDARQRVQVLSFVPSASVTRATVHETVTPSVSIDGRIVQAGQIIVATPESARSSSAARRSAATEKKTKRGWIERWRERVDGHSEIHPGGDYDSFDD